jgi:hypothetical protein
MKLPFSPHQFFGVFAQYNDAFWPVVAGWWVATIAALIAVWLRPKRWSPTLSLFLGAMWLWNAIAYHAWLFTRINPAAWLFSGLFAVQGVLFFWAGLRRTVEYFSSASTRRTIGLVFVAYSLAYPFLTIALGHRYPTTPTFGLPCPTVILTIGVLVTVRGGAPLSLVPIPIAWAFIGGSAAVLLSVATDFALLGAGALFTGTVIAQRRSTATTAVR